MGTGLPRLQPYSDLKLLNGSDQLLPLAANDTYQHVSAEIFRLRAQVGFELLLRPRKPAFLNRPLDRRVVKGRGGREYAKTTQICDAEEAQNLPSARRSVGPFGDYTVPARAVLIPAGYVCNLLRRLCFE
jgi:hypothetical protein